MTKPGKFEKDFQAWYGADSGTGELSNGDYLHGHGEAIMRSLLAEADKEIRARHVAVTCTIQRNTPINWPATVIVLIVGLMIYLTWGVTK